MEEDFSTFFEINPLLTNAWNTLSRAIHQKHRSLNFVNLNLRNDQIDVLLTLSSVDSSSHLEKGNKLGSGDPMMDENEQEQQDNENKKKLEDWSKSRIISPESLVFIWEIHLEENHLHYIPPFICRLLSLERLFLNNNHIKSLFSFTSSPSSKKIDSAWKSEFGALASSLKLLSLYSNQITQSLFFQMRKKKRKQKKIDFKTTKFHRQFVFFPISSNCIFMIIKYLPCLIFLLSRR